MRIVRSFYAFSFFHTVITYRIERFSGVFIIMAHLQGKVMLVMLI